MQVYVIDGKKPWPKFPMQNIMATSGAREKLTSKEITGALGRHTRGDWGDVCPEDWARNESALLSGDRLFSVYHTEAGVKFWIITEADRSVTTVLLPDEY